MAAVLSTDVPGPHLRLVQPGDVAPAPLEWEQLPLPLLAPVLSGPLPPRPQPTAPEAVVALLEALRNHPPADWLPHFAKPPRKGRHCSTRRAARWGCRHSTPEAIELTRELAGADWGTWRERLAPVPAVPGKFTGVILLEWRPRPSAPVVVPSTVPTSQPAIDLDAALRKRGYPGVDTAVVPAEPPPSHRSLSIAHRKSLPVYSRRPRSLGNDPIKRKERAALAVEVAALTEEGAYANRPRFLGPGVTDPTEYPDCLPADGGPCPWVSCRHHLYLEADPNTGAVKLNFPGLEIDDLKETCSRRVGDEVNKSGELNTLYEVGALLNVTEEWARQTQISGLAKIRTFADSLAAFGTDELDDFPGESDIGE